VTLGKFSVCILPTLVECGKIKMKKKVIQKVRTHQQK